MNDPTQRRPSVSPRDEEVVADDQAMLRLLDRPLTDDDLREATERVAQLRSHSAQDMASALLFRVGGELLAVPATDVARVTRVGVVRRIPHRSNHIIRGLCNIDGELVICGSLRELLELPDGVPTGNAVKHLASEGIRELSPVAGVARLQGSQENARILANPATKIARILADPATKIARILANPATKSDVVDRDERKMVVLGPESNRWAVEVDCVLGVRYYETASCKAPPVTVRQAMRCYTASLLPLSDDDVATLLNVSQVISGFKAALT